MNRLFKCISFFSFDDAGATTTDAAPVADAGSSAPADTPAPADAAASKPNDLPDIKAYQGSKDVNPNGRKLKNFDRSAFGSVEEIDAFIKAAGEDIFIPEDKKLVDKKVVDKKPDDKKPADKKPESDKKLEDSEPKDTEDKAGEEFLKTIGLTQEQFVALPEAVQEKLANGFDESSVDKKGYTELHEKHTKLVADIDKIKNDPIIAARLEELDTGKRFVATGLPHIGRKEVRQLIAKASDEDAFDNALNELITEKAHEVIRIERGVVERKVEREKQEKAALEVLQNVFAKEPKFGIKEKDLTKIKEGHPEFDKFFGPGGIMETLQRKKYTAMQIATKGVGEILFELAKERGWNADRDNKLVNKGAKNLLESIRKAAESARTLSPVRKAPPATPDVNSGFDSDSLIAEVAAGNMQNWNRLATKFEHSGDSVNLSKLNEIHEKGLRARRHK